MPSSFSWTPTSPVHTVAYQQQSAQAPQNHQQATYSQQPVQAQTSHFQGNPYSPQTVQSTQAWNVQEVATSQSAPSFEQHPRNQQESPSPHLQGEPQPPVWQPVTSQEQPLPQLSPVHSQPSPPAYQAVSRAQSVSSGPLRPQVIRKALPQSPNSSNTSTPIYTPSSPSAAESLTTTTNVGLSHSDVDLPTVWDLNVQGEISAPSPGRPVNMNPVSQSDNLGHSSSLRKSNPHRPQMIDVDSFCRICAHCRSGISYDKSYLECRFCQLYICNYCSNAHPSTHGQTLFGVISKQTFPNVARSEKGCFRCAKMVHCRHDCQECGATFCNDCQQKKDGAHVHRAFTSIEAPFHSIKVVSAASTQDCCSEITVSICTRCQGPIDLRQEALQCKTCLITYDGTVNLCHSCHRESWAVHDQSHEVISLIFQPVATDAENGLGCRQCDERFNLLDKTQLALHAHNSFLVYMGPRARESAVSAAFRLCQRKRVRKDRSQVVECARCKHEFPSQTMRICADDCRANFCDECFPLASLSHVHGPTNFRSLNDDACPEIGFLPHGWRAMRNSEGRNYYLQDETGHFTFQKPRLPDTLPPGWVAMMGTLNETIFVNKTTNSTSHVSPIFGTAPEGWDLKQTETGRLFYVNRQTQATTWHRPQPEDGDPLPPGWEKGRYADGRVYYINHFTKTNTWTRPTAPANAIPTPTSGRSHPLPVRSATAPSGKAQSPVSGPVFLSTREVQPTRPMSTSGQVHPVINSAQPAERLPVAALASNFQTIGSPVTLQGSVTIIPPQPANQTAGQNSVTIISAPQMIGQGSAQVPFTQSVAPQQVQRTVSNPHSSQGTTVGSALNTLANNPQAQKAALHLELAALNDSKTHTSSHSVASGNTTTHTNVNLSQSSTNGSKPSHSFPSTWTSNCIVNCNSQSQANGGVGNTGTTILTPTSNPYSFQSTVSTNCGSLNNSNPQNNVNIGYANNPPAYTPTGTEDPSAAITSSMANLMNSNGSVNDDNSQYQYSIGLDPPATSYIVADNSALTSSYYGVPQETTVQTQDVQVVEVSSTGASSVTDYTTLQTQTTGYPQDISVTSQFFGGSTVTDDVTTTGFEYTDTTGFEYTDSSAALDLI